MGSFKSLKRSDVFLTSYNSKKSWKIQGTDFQKYGIQILSCGSESLSNYMSLRSCFKLTYDPKAKKPKFDYDPKILYRGIKQDYFEDMQEDGSVSGSRDLSLQTTITVPSSRQVEDEFVILAIPRACFGTSIEERSLNLRISNINISDTEGILLGNEGDTLGDIIYNQGILIFRKNQNTSFLLEVLQQFVNVELEFVSNKPIYTYNVGCSVLDKDFNRTYNPTASEKLQLTEGFTPYVTSIGLYNSANELMAIAKVSKPIKKASNVDMNFNVSIDIT